MRVLKIVLSLLALPFIVLGGVYVVLGRTPAMALVYHGGAMFLPIAPDSARLSPSIRRVLAGDIGDPQPGPFAWRETEPGFSVGDMPVLDGSKEVDKLLLAKIDPTRFRIVTRNDASATTGVDDWLKRLAARLVINGSYYAPSGRPDTPFVADGRQIGPDPYDASQGAMVVSPDGKVTFADLGHLDWHRALAGARDGLVSYPLLLDADGKAKPVKASLWLANRTFVGQDGHGWIVIGTTKDAYFSLQRLAMFLEHSDLDLRAVLNLDGGPVSCQAVKSGEYRRDFCGSYEIQADGSGVKKLTWLWGRWQLPVAVAVVAR